MAFLPVSAAMRGLGVLQASWDRLGLDLAGLARYHKHHSFSSSSSLLCGRAIIGLRVPYGLVFDLAMSDLALLLDHQPQRRSTDESRTH